VGLHPFYREHFRVLAEIVKGDSSVVATEVKVNGPWNPRAIRGWRERPENGDGREGRRAS
jgi:hypothetical protein